MVKNRNIALCIILSLVTCGIYGLYWFVCLTDDTNTISGEPGTSGVVALVLTIVTCGIYGLYWHINAARKLMQHIRKMASHPVMAAYFT